MSHNGMAMRAIRAVGRRASMACSLLATAALIVPAGAATYDWSGGTSTDWNNAANWSGAVPTGADYAQFNSATYTRQPTVNAASPVGQLRMTAVSGAVTIGAGNTLTINGISGTGIDASAATALLTVNAAVALGGSQAWSAGASGLTVGSVVSGSGAALTLSGGTLTLNGNNTYSGGTTVSAGTLNIGGANNNESRVGPGTLTINAGASVVVTATNPLGWDTTANTPAVVINGGTFDYKTFDGSFRTLTMNGGTLTRTSAFWYFNQTGSITVTGGTPTISGGQMRLRPAGGASMPIDVTTGANLTMSTILANDAGNAGFNKTSGGTLTLSGINTFSGDVTLIGGTLIGAATTAFGAGNNARTITVSSGATLNFSAVGGMYGAHTATAVPSLVIAGTLTNGGVGDYMNNPLNNLTLNGAAMTSTVGSLNGWGAWNINGDITSTGTSSISSGGADQQVLLKSSGSAPYNTNVTVGDGTLTVSAPLLDGRNAASPFAAHATRLTKLGAGTLTLTGANTYSGGTTVSAGTLQLGDGTTNGSVAGNITDNATLVFNVGTATSPTYSGAIGGNGVATKTGNGTLTLTGDSTFSGGTTVNNGTLQLGGADNNASRVGPGLLTVNAGGRVVVTATNPLGWDTTANTPAVAINGGTFDFATFHGSFRTLTMNGGTLTRTSGFWYFNQTGSISATGGLPTISGGIMDLRPAGGTSMPIDVAAGVTLTISAVLANNTGGVFGAAGFEKTGNGTLTLAAPNTYAGGTTVSGGTLLVNGSHGAALPYAVNSGGTLGGGGTIWSSVAVGGGGRVAPGGIGGTGVLHINNNVTLSTTSVFHVDLNGPVLGSQYDQVSMSTGTFQINNATLTVAVGSGYKPTAGTVFEIVSSTAATSGTFAGLAPGQEFLPPGSPAAFVIAYDNTSTPRRILLTARKVDTGTLFVVR